jgi:hypothetical protein
MHKTVNNCDTQVIAVKIATLKKLVFPTAQFVHQTPSLLSIHLQTHHFAEYKPHLLFVQVF